MLLLLTVSLAPAVVAQEEVIEATESAKEAQQQRPQSTEYTLPYPGILPDNPLYALKMLRDRVVGYLISDPVKKAEFNLLQADKRLASAIGLMDKGGKTALSEETLSKGANYFEEALNKAREAKEQGMDVADIERRLASSARKHVAVLMDMQTELSGDEKEKFMQLEKRMQSLQISADRLIKTE